MSTTSHYLAEATLHEVVERLMRIMGPGARLERVQLGDRVQDPAPCIIELDAGELVLQRCPHYAHCQSTGEACETYRAWLRTHYPVPGARLRAVLARGTREPDSRPWARENKCRSDRSAVA